MKRFLLLLSLASVLAPAALCQETIMGSKAPELRAAGWYGGRVPQRDGRAQLIEFFHSSGRNASARIAALDSLGRRFAGRLTVILVSRESAEKLSSAFPAFRQSENFYTAFDDGGKTFSAYGVQFVPYAVLIDRRGRVAWLGNPATLTEADIDRTIR